MCIHSFVYHKTVSQADHSNLLAYLFDNVLRSRRLSQITPQIFRMGLLPIFLCFELNTFLGSGLVFACGTIYGFMALGKKVAHFVNSINQCWRLKGQRRSEFQFQRTEIYKIEITNSKSSASIHQNKLTISWITYPSFVLLLFFSLVLFCRRWSWNKI